MDDGWWVVGGGWWILETSNLRRTDNGLLFNDVVNFFRVSIVSNLASLLPPPISSLPAAFLGGQ